VIDRLHAAALVASGGLLIVVFELVRRRKLTEEYSFLWLLTSLAMLGLSIRPEILYGMAGRLSATDPIKVLVLLLIAIGLVASLCFSVIVSRQRQQIERLIEETAILSAELRELRAEKPRPEESWERIHTERRRG
jgi:hypothetical protein